MSEIESVKPILTVVLDDGDFIINSTGDIGKAMVQTVLPMAAGAWKVTIISDGLMRVMKRAAGNGQVPQTAAEHAAMQQPNPSSIPPARRPASPLPPASDPGPDIQDQFAADLAAGRVGEAAMGEQPSPTPGPNDPTPVPATPPARRRPQIFQDAAAPPAPELAEAEMARLLAEAAEADQAAAQVAEDRRFQRQQAVQAQVEEAAPAEPDPAAAPRTRTRPARSLATTGRPCGRCGGGGQIIGDAGFQGACPVCHGEGQVKTWDRSLKVR